jgi:cytochrome bd ubiquinol oxidase subunit II
MISIVASAPTACGCAPSPRELAAAAWPPSRALVVAAVMVGGLVAYSLSGGADFGGGVWDLLARGPRRSRQRAAIAHAIGPIWEANHVWLILVVVLLFTCFPPAFADLMIVLHIPLSLMLVGIVLRGSTFAFRSYDVATDHAQPRWGRIFAVASLVTPFLLGTVVGAIASGSVGRAAASRAQMTFADTYVASWVTPFALAVGLLALALFAFLAAVYLTVAVENDKELQDDFRRRALAAAIAVLVAAAGTLALAPTSAPEVGGALVFATWAHVLHAATAVAAVAAVVALVWRRFRVARIVAAAQVACIIVGWALAQYPYVVPPTHTIEGAAAPPATLGAVLIAVAAGAVILFPSLFYLFRVFTGADDTHPAHRPGG